jgi:uncharacterized membrane protein
MMLIDSIHYFMTVEYAIFLILAILTIFAFRKNNLEVIKARAFLDKNFLNNNFIFIILSGSILAIHEFFNMGYENGILQYSYQTISEGLEDLSLIFLILWMYAWWRLETKKVK